MTIELIGENKIEMTGELAKTISGIWVGDDLVFQGNGSIDIKSGNTTGDGSDSIGISCYGGANTNNLTVKDCTIKTVSGNTKENNADSYGILTDNIKIESGNVTAKAGITEGSNTAAHGIWARDKFLITGGTVYAEGNNAGYYTAGINASDGFEITGGIVNAVSHDGKSFTYGINTNSTSEINISGGGLIASASAGNNAWALSAKYNSDKLIIDDSLSIFAGENEDGAIKVDKYSNQKYARIEKSYDLWVGDTQITSTNANDVFNDGKVSYDDSTKTLALTNYSLNIPGWGGEDFAIKSGLESLTIVGTGEIANGSNNCILAEGDLTIGDGSTNTNLIVNTDLVSGKYGINAAGDNVINSATVKAAGGSGSDGAAIYSSDGSIEIKGENTKVTATVINGMAITAGGDNGITIAEPLKITKPENGVFSSDGKTICESDGTTLAKEVVIEKLEGIGIYTITFDAGEGTVNPSSAQTNAEGKLESLPIPENGDAEFLGWFTAEDGGEQVTTDTVFTADSTISAHYKEATATVFTITFDAGEGTIDPASAQTNAEGKLAKLPTPVLSGYNFAGWFTEEDGGDRVTTATIFTEDTTIYAQWKKKSTGSGGRSGSVSFTLTYETNGGEKIKAESHKAGDEVTLDKTPVKDGYTFTGWYADKECTQKIESITMNSSKTVYAGWSNGAEVIEENAPLLVVTIDETKYQLNGKNMEMDSAPFIDENDRTMLPVRVVANALGISDADIVWDDNTKTASFTRPDGKVVSCTVGIKTIKIGDEEVEIDTAPVIRNDRIYLPMRALFNAFNVSDDHIAWDGAARKVTVAKEALDDINALTEVAPVEEEPVEEVPAEETPAAETPAKETPAEETPAEEA